MSGYRVEGEASPVVRVVAKSPRCQFAILQRDGQPPVLSIRVVHSHRPHPADIRTAVLHIADLDALEEGIAAVREHAAKETP